MSGGVEHAAAEHPAGPRGEQGAVERRILMPIFDRVFGATYEDMRRMESILQESSMNCIALRPPGSNRRTRPAPTAWTANRSPGGER
jgi:hypothetical protein